SAPELVDRRRERVRAVLRSPDEIRNEPREQAIAISGVDPIRILRPEDGAHDRFRVMARGALQRIEHASILMPAKREISERLAGSRVAPISQRQGELERDSRRALLDASEERRGENIGRREAVLAKLDREASDGRIGIVERTRDDVVVEPFDASAVESGEGGKRGETR